MEDAMQAAIQNHQRGRLQDAVRLYQAILDRQPNHADALHLLGVAAYQSHQFRQATDLIARAIALRPAASAYHANLGEVWRTMGQLDRAADSCRAALRLRPDYPEALLNLGLVLKQSGDPGAAVEHFRRALALRPDFAAAHNGLGNALRSMGDSAAAVEHFRQAVRCDPRSAEARTNLGQLHCERRELHEALEHCRLAVELRPDLAEAQSNLGNVLRELGRLDDARRHYTEAFRLAPQIGMIHNNMAQLLQEEGRVGDALAWYRRALVLDAGSPRIRCNLAGALVELDRPDDAAAEYRAALELDPRCVEAHHGLGVVRHEQRRDAEAKAHLLAALEIEPGHAPTLGSLGVLLEEVGDLRAAEEWLRAALAHDPGHAGALSHMATMLRGRLPVEDLAALRGLLAEPDQRPGRNAALRFGLAQALDARGEFAEAADHLREANALALDVWRRRGDGYEPARHATLVSEMISSCSPAFFDRTRGLGLDSERPVFVFGLPRSGTTLIEQILASHSRVFGAGELGLAVEHFESLPAAVGSPEPPVSCLARLDCSSISAVGLRYLDRLGALDATADRVVDKMPDNYLYLGLLAALFPRAKFIHCRRDLRDVAVSCWMTNFRRIRWANDPGHIASRFAEYERLAEHWRAVLPVPVLEVAYEDTVADLEGVARRLVDWCGLAWETACLEFHKTERPVRTASVAQVRQPLYMRSVGRWKRYEPALASLFAQLVPTGLCSIPRPDPPI